MWGVMNGISDAGTKPELADVTVDAGVKFEMVNVASDVSTMSTIGEVAIEAGILEWRI